MGRKQKDATEITQIAGLSFLIRKCNFKKKISYSFIFGCIGSLSLHRLFSGYSKRGLLSSCGAQASHCSGFSCCRARALDIWASVVETPRLQSTGPVVVVQRLSCSVACGIFPDKGSNPCFLHWQVVFTTEPPGKPHKVQLCACFDSTSAKIGMIQRRLA